MALREYYDSHWSPGDSCPGAHTSDYVLAAIDPHLGPGIRVLDLGCGDGGLIGSRVAPRAESYWRRRLGLAAAGRWNPGGGDLSVLEPGRDPHIRFFTVTSLRRMVEGAGFESIEVTGHDGALLADAPLVKRLARGRGSALYRLLERRFPSLLGAGLLVIARTPR